LYIFSSDIPKNRITKRGNATFHYIKIPLIVKKLRIYYLFYVPIILVSALKSDILFTNEAYKTASIAGLISKVFQKKIILFYGTLYFQELELHSRQVSSIPKSFKIILYKTMEFIMASTIDLIIAPDSRASKYFGNHKLRPKIFDWINIGTVDTNQFKFDPMTKIEYRKKLQIPNSDVVLLFVGDISERDGADIAIESFYKISSQRSDVWLVMIGSGSNGFISGLKEKISARQMDNVILTGHVPHSLIQNYMMTADIAVLPYQEPNCGIGNIIVELMSIGIPIVASNYSDIKKVIIDGQTGFVAEDKEDFIDKTEKIVTNEKLRKKFSLNYRNYALEHFSYQAFSRKFSKILNQI